MNPAAGAQVATSPSEFLRGYGLDGPTQPASRVPDEFASRLPDDTVDAARVTAGVRLECVGSASALTLEFTRAASSVRGAPTMPAGFSVWLGARLTEVFPVPDGGEVTIPLPARSEADVVTIYLPDPVPLSPVSIRGLGGTLAPAPRLPRWVVYGDSIVQGWSASDPGLTWPAIAGRALGLDPVNLGFAGAARGEAASADQVAATAADVVTVAWGTNCWSMIPFDADQMTSTTAAFLETVRRGHPDAPVLVVGVITRPEVEQTPNIRGATLAQLRDASEAAVRRFIEDTGDEHLQLLPGLPLVPGDLLVDGIHPGDEGHAVLAAAAVTALQQLMDPERHGEGR